MNKHLLFLLLNWYTANLCPGQVFNPAYGEIVDQCSRDTILANLQTYECQGIKEPGSLALEKTKTWILSKYKAYGYTDIREDAFEHSGRALANIVVTKTGSVHPESCIIIDGHYDTKNGPGANDNGSGTVAILEIARLLKDVKTAYSIKFIHFTGEEEGYLGSRHYVDHVLIPEHPDIILVFNIDAVGGVNGLHNHRVSCERDQISPPSYNNAASSAITHELAECARLYSDLDPQITHACGSDYIPFEYHGMIITGLYESNISEFYHTADDVIGKLDIHYVYEVTRAAVGATLYFSNTPFSSTGGSRDQEDI